MSGFQATYWNFTQTMAWVFLGDRRLVERADEEVWEFGSFVEEVVTPDGERKLIDVQSDPPNSLTMTLLAAAKGGAAYPKYTDAEKALIKKLQEGALTALGVPNGQGDLIPIETSAWADLGFYWDRRSRAYAAPKKDPLRARATQWLNLKFHRPSVMRIWPDPFEKNQNSISSQAVAEVRPAPAFDPKPRSVLKRKHLSLSEAVTLLAFGEAHESDAQFNDVATEINELRELMDRCWAEAKINPKCADFPSDLACSPFSELIEELDDCRHAWPPTAERLYEFAKFSRAAEAESKIERAEEALKTAAYDGIIILLGKDQSNNQFKKIPNLYFSKPRTLIWLDDKIYPTVGLDETGAEDSVWLDVHVETEGFISNWPELFNNTELEAERPTQPPLSEKQSKRRGRPKGSGSFKGADGPIVEKMHKWLQDKPEGTSLTEAARNFVEEAAGAGTQESKEQRLVRRYKERFPDDKRKD